MLEVPGAPWWLNWLVIYPMTAVCVLMAFAMVCLMVFGLTVKFRWDDHDSEIPEDL